MTQIMAAKDSRFHTIAHRLIFEIIYNCFLMYTVKAPKIITRNCHINKQLF